jgi:hypothetical protein
MRLILLCALLSSGASAFAKHGDARIKMVARQTNYGKWSGVLAAGGTDTDLVDLAGVVKPSTTDPGPKEGFYCSVDMGDVSIACALDTLRKTPRLTRYTCGQLRNTDVLSKAMGSKTLSTIARPDRMGYSRQAPNGSSRRSVRRITRVSRPTARRRRGATKQGLVSVCALVPYRQGC